MSKNAFGLLLVSLFQMLCFNFTDNEYLRKRIRTGFVELLSILSYCLNFVKMTMLTNRFQLLIKTWHFTKNGNILKIILYKRQHSRYDTTRVFLNFCCSRRFHMYATILKFKCNESTNIYFDTRQKKQPNFFFFFTGLLSWWSKASI